jgi:hypothetical protein
MYQKMYDQHVKNLAADTQKTLGGHKAGQFLPKYLTQSGFAGEDMVRFFEEAFQMINDPRAKARKKTEIGQESEAHARQVESRSRFRGSPLGEMLAGSIRESGQERMDRSDIEHDNQRLMRGLQLSQGLTGAFTNPLLQGLGIFEGSVQSQANRQLQKDMQPGFLESVFSGICWVAREVMPDRWQAARAYLIMEAPRSLLEKYAAHGESLSKNLTPEDYKTLRPVFEAMADKGEKYLEG